MEIDLTKYVTNKDLEIKNEDFDLKKLGKDLYKGYTKNEDIPTYKHSDADFDKLQSDYSSLENNYNGVVKSLDDTNTKLARVSMENILVKDGFKEENFDEVIKLRQSLYAEEKDDGKAFGAIKEKFKNTYFEIEKKEEPISEFTKAPDEGSFKGNGEKETLKITRKTSIRDLLIKK